MKVIDVCEKAEEVEREYHHSKHVRNQLLIISLFFTWTGLLRCYIFQTFSSVMSSRRMQRKFWRKGE